MSLYQDKPWLQFYPETIPAEIELGGQTNLASVITRILTENSEKVAFYFMDKSLTYGKLNELSDIFGAYLLDSGLKRGDKVALMMPNIFQYPIALFGVLKAGLIAVNTNPLYTPFEMEHQFKDAGVKSIIICENFAHNLEKIIERTPIEQVIVTGIGDLLGGVKGWVTNFVIRNVKKMVPPYRLPNAIKFNHVIKSAKHLPKPIPSGDLDDVVILQYTGGTSGVSKGAMLTNRNLLANMEQIRVVFKSLLKEGEEFGICALPLYHIFAFTVNCLALLSLECPSLLIVNARDITTLIKEWKKYPVSIFPGVNTLFNGLLHHPEFKTIDFTRLKLTIAGAMALQKSVFENWKNVTGVSIVEGYGLTETSPVACVNPLDGGTRFGTIGIPVPSTEMRIIDDFGYEVPVGDAGEIQIKGPQVMKGYHNNLEESSRALINGWFSTGDIGVMSNDGFFSIVDRKKDMILVSGFNVYPNEVEDAAASHPKVLESAAIGIPDDKSGEVVKLFVVKKDPSLTEQELTDHLRNYLTNYKIPRQIEFKSDLPKTNVGKILRRSLRA